MSTPRHERGKPLSITISTTERPKFTEPLAAYLFDEHGELVDRADVKAGKAELATPAGGLGRHRVFIAPPLDPSHPVTAAALQRLGGYEPVLHLHESPTLDIRIPGLVIDHWPFCVCWVRGRVVRSADNRAVCDARVHICEVDRLPWIIARLPDIEVLKVRDDLLDLLRHPPRPVPPWPPDPDPGPFPGPRPGPDPAPFARGLFRFDRGAIAGFDPQPDPPGTRVGLNPQPLPPRVRAALNPQPEPPSARALPVEAIQLAPELHAQLRSPSALVVRETLVANWKLLLPWLCWWPWFWRYRCDEVAVVTTGAQGRFEATVFYPCGGDRPDLYFWVEYDFGSGFETVYNPGVRCHTYWDYTCGTEVTLRVTDPRVPGCEQEPDLPGCQVVVLSIGPGVAVREVQATGATEGQTQTGQPFGHTLEPRVDFSRTELITGKNVPYYRWSYRRLTRPDGNAGAVDGASVPLNVWTPLVRDVYRHYKLGTSFPSELMGPMPSGPAPAPNLFRIRPQNPPAGTEWVVLNESVDLATAYFDTHLLAGATAASPTTPDLAAGRYELKLELFDAAGALVNWTAKGIDLRITDQDAPFGPGTITTSPAPDHNRVLAGANTMGFRMVVRVDNNRCFAEINPVGGTVTPDPLCGFHNYSDPSDTAALSFVARHPNHFATYGFSTTRGAGPLIPAAGASGVAGEAGTNGFVEISDFTYAKDVIIAALLGPCGNAAYAEHLDVHATATNGYGTLTGYNASDNAAFALAVPCPTCDCDDEEDGNGPD
jgi:hypothetical protein